MRHSSPLLCQTDAGWYCSAGDFYIDPVRRVPRAVISHGHSDHARRGMGSYLCHHHSVPILQHRLGATISIHGIEYGQPISINGVTVSLHPAGHIIGSAQVRVEYRGEVWVYSGDYKRQPDPFAPAFEVVPCHTFITETTFGLPLYAWPDVDDVRTDINAWWRWHAERETVCVVQVYPLGKAQRLMGIIDTSIGPIVAHGSIHAMNSVLASAGHALPTWRELLPTMPAALLKGALVLSSAQTLDFLPSNLGIAHAAASGWMALASRRAAYDAAFVVSDHVDWRGILDTIADTGAERVITTHGYADVVARYLRERGLDAASHDASHDAASQHDAAHDAASQHDASHDAAHDALHDAASQQDASHDAAHDASHDAASQQDAAHDAASQQDAAHDASHDASHDAASQQDAAHDASHDASQDAASQH